jgi:single-stranded-DNA-specific exonuclease
MDTAYLPFLQENLMRFAADTLSPEDLQPMLHLDAVVALADMTPALVAELERCEPYGAGNPTPLFCAHAVQLASPVRRLGQQGQHARFRVTQDGVTLNVVAFHQAEQVLALPAGAVVDLAFTPTLNTWRDQSQLELHVRAIRPHTSLHHVESH